MTRKPLCAQVARRPGSALSKGDASVHRTAPRETQSPATGEASRERQATRTQPRTRSAATSQSALPHVAPEALTPAGHRGHGHRRAGGRRCPQRPCSGPASSPHRKRT